MQKWYKKNEKSLSGAFIHLPGQGHGGYGDYPGNTGHKAEINNTLHTLISRDNLSSSHPPTDMFSGSGRKPQNTTETHVATGLIYTPHIQSFKFIIKSGTLEL